MQMALYAVVGLGAGILGGWLGIGGGALLVPLLILAFGVDTKIAIGTSLAVIVPIATAAATRHSLLDKVNWAMFWPMAVCGVIGGLIGAWLLDKINPDWTKRALSVFWVYAAVRLWMTTMPAR
jgi:uncharacterized membrane protein YfcA